VDLIVRGICCLRPGIKGISENIRVISVVGRYLEHSRIFYFHNAGKEEIYMGSADLMTRNLSHRVEVVFPVESPKDIKFLREQILEMYLRDGIQARVMQTDGSYRYMAPRNTNEVIDIQQWLMQQYKAKNF
jgi:polyphosphate kinase